MNLSKILAMLPPNLDKKNLVHNFYKTVTKIKNANIEHFFIFVKFIYKTKIYFRYLKQNMFDHLAFDTQSIFHLCWLMVTNVCLCPESTSSMGSQIGGGCQTLSPLEHGITEVQYTEQVLEK